MKFDLKIIVGIPTFKRPESLNRLLLSLSSLKTEINFTILVADNEGHEGQGIKLVQNLASSNYRYLIKSIPVVQRGISHVRNAILVEAFDNLSADILIMVDDDESVHEDWLTNLIKVKIKEDADIVWGYVVPKFEGHAPEWTNNLSIYHRNRKESGIILDVCGAGCVLLTKRVYNPSDMKKNLFDERFSLTGGEDTEFFTRIKRDKLSNFVCAYSSESITYEHIPLSRQTKSWALKRAFRIGSIDIKVIKMYGRNNKSISLFKEFAVIVLAISHGIMLSIIYFISKEKCMVGPIRVSRQIGKMAGFFNLNLNEYRIIHGK